MPPQAEQPLETAAIDHQIKMFALLVEQANVIAAARRDTSRFFLAFNSAAFGVLGYIAQNTGKLPPTVLIALCGLTGLASILWLFMLRYYGSLSQAKFQVIRQLEEVLPFRPYHLEDEIMRKRSFVGVAVLEQALPLFFLTGYAIIAWIGSPFLHSLFSRS
jgi:hypothetical protein